MSKLVVVLNGDKIYMDELIRENARLRVQVEAERQHGRKLSADLSRARDRSDQLAEKVEQLEEDLNLAAMSAAREKALAAKLDQAVKDLHFVMAGGDACKVCKNKCMMGTADACDPRWKGLDE